MGRKNKDKRYNEIRDQARKKIDEELKKEKEEIRNMEIRIGEIKKGTKKSVKR